MRFIFITLFFITSVAHAADVLPVMRTNVVGGDETHAADVLDDSGVKRLQVSMVGESTVIPGGIGKIILLSATAGASADLRVNGSVTPVVFTFASDTVDQYIYEIRLFAMCNGIKFGQHLCKNTALTNGIEIKIKSEDTVLTLPIMYTTEDYKNKFSSAGLFRIDIQAGADGMLAIMRFDDPFVIKKTGTYTPNDYVTITIRDDLTGSTGGNLQEFTSLFFGFKGD